MRNFCRHALLAQLALVYGSFASSAAALNGKPGDTWLGAWAFAPTSFTPAAAPLNNAVGATSNPTAARAPAPPPDFDHVTVRQIVRIAAPAERLRIRISNEFGDKPLKLGAVHVALAAEDGATVPGSDHVLTFAGAAAISVPAGAPMLSDPLPWALPALTSLAISVFVPDDTVPPAHRLMEYIAAGGDFTAEQHMPAAALVRSGALVSEVEIVSPLARKVVVTLGDSITEGVGSTPNAFRSWPDRLAERLSQNPATRGWSLVNAGIGSNRLLHNNPGTGALARFDRDVLAVPAVAAVLLLEGINDIGYSQTTPGEAVSAEDIIAAYRQLIARAHEHGITLIVGTITPFEGSHYYDQQGEQVRAVVNQWIRSSGAFDGVVDFDAALRDPAHPTKVLESLQRGDNLHPNDAGYAAMGDAIDLKLFTAQARNTGLR